MPGERGESVFLSTSYEGLFSEGDEKTFGNAFWQEVISIRESVSKELEAVRANGAIGSALDAEVTLYCADDLYQKLNKLDDELRFILITSGAQVKPLSEKTAQASRTDNENLFVQIDVSEHEKCVRCWHHREDVGQSAAHPELCGRCVDNVEHDGEIRRFA
jgi:isoleucyl-tRNA synthetase